MGLTERIKDLAAPKGYTLASLEREAELGQGTIRKWSSNVPSADKLMRVATLLETSMDYLMSGKYAISRVPQNDALGIMDLFYMLPVEAQYEFMGEIKGYLKRMADEAEEDVVLPKTGTGQGK